MLLAVIAHLAALSTLANGQSVAIVKATGPVYPRLDISTFFSPSRNCGKEQAVLLTSAFIALEKAPESDMLSFASIAGIYTPLVDKAYDNWKAGKGEGYVAVGNPEFPYWNRAYMALFEDALKKSAVQIAIGFSDTKYAECAASLRLPYWDWAKLPFSLPPPVLSVTVSLPSGTVSNPLNAVYLPASILAKLSPKPAPVFAVRQNSGGPDKTFQKRVLSMFDNADWKTFSTFNGGPNSGYISLESISASIHALFGGWMGFSQTASFDPLFYFHLCNVDRLLALWSQVNPNGFPENTTASKGMAPFRAIPNDDSSAWTATQMRSTASAFGYTYPELLDNPSPASLKATLVRMYQPPVKPVARARHVKPVARIPPE